MRKIILIIAMLSVFLSPCYAKDIYISETAQGNDSGINCINGHSAAWFNDAANWGMSATQIAAGDTVHLCGTITTSLTVNGSGISGYPVTMLWESGARLSRPTWNSGTGFISAINKSFIVLDGGANGIIEATDNGTMPVFGGTKNHANDIYGVYFSNCIDCEIKNLKILGIYDRIENSPDCTVRGFPIYWIGNLSGGTIHNNTITDGTRCVLGAFSGTSTDGFNVYSNVISNCGVGINVAMANTSASAKNVNIYFNTITGGSKWDGIFGSDCVSMGCSATCTTDRWHHQDGIHSFAFSGGTLEGLKIHSNYLQDFGTHSTAHIYVEGLGVSSPLIYNNVVASTGLNYPSNGAITVRESNGARIYNNTIIGNEKGTAILLNNRPTNVEIKNNIISRMKTGIYYQSGTTLTSNYNCFYGLTPGWEIYADGLRPWSWWQAQGQDANSVIIDPKLSFSYKLTAGSPAILRQGGVNLSAIFTTDKIGVSRNLVGGWSIGAFQYSGTSSLSVPSGLKIVQQK